LKYRLKGVRCEEEYAPLQRITVSGKKKRTTRKGGGFFIQRKQLFNQMGVRQRVDGTREKEGGGETHESRAERDKSKFTKKDAIP